MTAVDTSRQLYDLQVNGMNIPAKSSEFGYYLGKVKQKVCALYVKQ